jgi:ribonuclease E
MLMRLIVAPSKELAATLSARNTHLLLTMTDRSNAGDLNSPDTNDNSQSSSPGFGEMSDTSSSQSKDTEAPRRRPRRRKKASASADRTAEDRTAEDRTSEGSTSEGSTSEGRTSEGRTANETSSEGEGRPRRSGRRRKRSPSSEGAEAKSSTEGGESTASTSSEASGAEGAEGKDGERRARGRRGRRGGRRSRRSGEENENKEASKEPVTTGSAAGETKDGAKEASAAGAKPEEGGRGRSRSRSSRGRKRRSDSSNEAVAIDLIPFEDDELPPVKSSSRGGGGTASSKKSSRRGKKTSAKADDEGKDSAEPRSRRKKSTRGGTSKAVDEKPKSPKRILVNAKDREETRVAVVQGGKIVDFQMTVQSERSHVNDIYRGRVVNLEQSIGAAFVDFGRGKNGFLHTSDVLGVYGDKDWSIEKLLTVEVDPEDWDNLSNQPSMTAEVEDESEVKKDEKASKKKVVKKKPARRRFHARPRLPIKDLLKVGNMVVCQVTKDAIGDKGPTLTTYLSITGHYLVLTPNMTRKGVSRKIESVRERKRLRKILDTFELPEQLGLICRTASKGRSAEELQRDLDGLLEHWEKFGKRLRSGRGPMLLYEEPEVAVRTVREHFDSDTEVVLVDDVDMHAELCKFADAVMPEFKDRIKLYDGKRPLFREEGMEEEFERIFSRRVELPSGGSIVLDQTEALVAIDVNSGRTRSASNDFEDIALKTNLEAVPEVARQMRLRDFGGIIVVDFIDMMKRDNIRKVEQSFADELSRDRARSKVGRISQFGILEMTRERGGPGIIKKLFTNCPRCRGEGKIRTVQSRSASILRRLQSSVSLKGFSQIEVRAHVDAIEYVKKICFDDINALEEASQRKITFIEAPDQLEDSVLRYLRADGREVRPGGRKKR